MILPPKFANDVPFGISYCVSKKSLANMPWAVEFAESHEASLIQFHALGATGRGQSLSHISLDKTEKTRAYLIALLLKKSKRTAIQIDLVATEQIRRQRNDYELLNFEVAHNKLLSDLVNPLIINELGDVLPFSYGINPSFKISSINYGLLSSIEEYKNKRWKRVKSLIDYSINSIESSQEEYLDWFQYVVDNSYKKLAISASSMMASRLLKSHHSITYSETRIKQIDD